MKLIDRLSSSFAVLVLGAGGAHASTVIGDLNNFDTLNDTGQTCYGFEIEIDDIHSTDITYTYDWNHYGAPKIREDNADPLHPKVFVRYESSRDASGSWGANGSFTNVAIPTITPPAGHSCTDPSVNEGCEHFGVGYYGAPTTTKYNWLVDGGGAGLVTFGTPVSIGTPAWTYVPPAPAQPAQVVAAMPAPAVPNPVGLEFGEPSWVKVVKTTTHNANAVVLGELISDDANGDGLADWQNAEPSEVETEFFLLQENLGGNAKAELVGMADDMGDGSETVTRRYEFYRYGAAPDTLDGETGEAMCSEVDPTTDPNDPSYLHGVGSSVAVTDPNGDTYYVDCAAQVVVGNYVGAQMAGFDAAAPLGLVDHLQDGDSGTPYMPRTVVVGGDSPYAITVVSGSLPPGLTLGDYTDPDSGRVSPGVLAGTPSAGGDFPFTIQAIDATNAIVSRAYSLHVTGAPVQQLDLVVAKLGSGSGTVTGNNIQCGASCSAHLDAGTAVSLSAIPDTAGGSVFSGWSGACAGSGTCDLILNASSTVYATFTQQWLLSVLKAGGGAGTVTGSGIACGATCSIPLDAGTAVSLAATPASGSYFTGWSGDCAGTGACATTMTGPRTATATFVPSTQQFTLSVTHTGSGTVTSTPKGISCGNKCSKTFAVGSSVTLTASPAKKHAFLGWTGACSGTSPTCVVPMLGNRSVGASFN